MKFLDSYDLVFSTLSPVHIGTTEDYLPTNYVIDGDALYAFDSARLSGALPEQDRTRLLGIVSGKPEDTTLLEVQRLIHRHRDRCKSVASHYLPVVAGVRALYEERIGQVAQSEGRKRRVVNRLEIQRSFYNPVSQRPVLPGTSLKGAIRTALLDAVNRGQPLSGNEKTLLKDRRDAHKANQALQQRLLNYSFRDLDADPFRLIRVADAHWSGDSDVPASEIRFAVDRPRQVKAGKEQQTTMADERGLYQLLETIPGLMLRTFQGQLQIHDLHWIPEPRKGRLPDSELRWSFEQIASACNRFYRPLLDNELDQLHQRSYVHPNWYKQLRGLLDGELGQHLASNQAFLLRVGRHSGAEAVTLNNLRSIKIMLGKDKQTNKPRQIYESQPRTVWLAADAQKARSAMLPFGWVLVEQAGKAELPGLCAFAEAYQRDLRQWYANQRDALEAVEDELRVQQAEEQRRWEAQRREAEEQAERERQLNELTEEQREIHKLRVLFERDQAANNKQPGGELASKTAELIAQGKAWPSEDRQQLADLAEKIYRFIGGSGKKKQERRIKIQALRDGEP